MKKHLLCCLAIVAIMLTTSSAMADVLVPNTAYDLYMVGYTSLGTNNAAMLEYDFYNDAAANGYTADYGYSPNAVSTYTKGGVTREFFYSFCLEKNITISSKTNYNGVLNETGQYTTTENNEDYISIGTAWLYYQFATGQLSGFEYSSKNDITALQHAIWFLENEVTPFPSSVNNEFYNLAVAEFGAAAATNYNLSQDFYNGDFKYTVYALNITKLNGADTQDGLFMTRSAVPEPTTILIWGIGICLAAVGYRRFKK